jgi:hypothetical protein
MSVGIATCYGFVLVASGDDEIDNENENHNKLDVCARRASTFWREIPYCTFRAIR